MDWRTTALMVSALIACTGGVSLAAEPLPSVQQSPYQILGGAAASIEEFPWQVALVAEGAPLVEGHFCGGSVVGPTWVLTAAHCVVDGPFVTGPDEFSVYYGSASKEGGGRLVSVRRVVVHPQYLRPDFANDIALVQLAAPIDAMPLPLAGPLTASALETPGLTAVVTGWGLYRAPAMEGLADVLDLRVDLTTRDLLRPTLLQSAELPIVSVERCAEAFGPTSRRRPIDARMVCAGFVEDGIDACAGDSGGPLQIRDARGDYVQIGLVSWGRACATGGFYGVYTRVSAHYAWLTAVMAGAEGAEWTGVPSGAARATYGAVVFSGGRSPDPLEHFVEAGGRVEDPTGRCAGHVAEAPDLSIDYEAGSDRGALYVAASSDADTTLVVVAPDGGVHCNDDFQERDPAVVIEDAATGEYLVWVGTYDSPDDVETPPATLTVSKEGAHFAR